MVAIVSIPADKLHCRLLKDLYVLASNMLIAAMRELRMSLRIITVLTVLFFVTLPEVLCNNFQGGIIMVRPKAGGEPKEVRNLVHYFIRSLGQAKLIHCLSSGISI